MSDFYKLSPRDRYGNQYLFDQLKDKVVLIVNVASKCGLANQFGDLEALNQKYKDEGLVIIAFPCSQFGNQEPGLDEDIAPLYHLKYGVSFPVMKKISVNGRNADQVYNHLKKEKPGLLGIKKVKWNFEKFLIDRQGHVVKRYASLTKPLSLKGTIESLL